MSIQELVVHSREKSGKGHAKKLRRTGLIPSVVYGMEGGSRPVVVEPKLVNKILHGEKGMNTVLNLRLGDSERTRHVMIKAVDRHPVTGRLVHVDFLRIDMDAKIHAVIPVELEGMAKGVRLGGVITIVRHEIEIECLPKDLPSSLRIDVSHLDIDEAVRIEDLPAIDGVAYQLETSEVIAVVHPPVKEEEPEEEEAVDELAADAEGEGEDEGESDGDAE